MTLPPAAELLGTLDTGAATLDLPGTPAPDAAPAAPTDEVLLARFLKGDRDALGALAVRYEPALLGLASGITGRRDLALEAVQETWLRVIKYGRTFRSGSSVKTWLYRILINTCNDTRSRNARLRLTTNPERERAGPDNSLTPDLPRLRTAIDGLSGDQILLILLCYHNGLTHPQAADVLNIPLGTLKSRLNTTLNTLRLSLREPSPREPLA